MRGDKSNGIAAVLSPAEERPSPRVFLIGLTTVDVFIKQAAIPSADQHEYLDYYRMLPGGSAANVAYSLVHLGAQAFFCSRTGEDLAGALVRESLENSGVDVHFVSTDPSLQTGFSIVAMHSAGRIGLLHHEGANRMLAQADLCWDTIRQSDSLHVGGAMSLASLDGEPLADALKTAKNTLHKTVSLHTSRNTDMRETLLPSLAYLDFLVTNDKEAAEITGRDGLADASHWFHDKGVAVVAITCGPAGAYVSNPKEAFDAPAYKVEAVDTTGCGDAFTAGFLYAYLKGEPLWDCAMLGNALGAHCATAIGAMPKPFTYATMLAKCKA
jgi:sugar/nucleoside kinase (ribokinase family)